MNEPLSPSLPDVAGKVVGGPRMELAQVVDGIRAQLTRAVEDAEIENSRLRFELDSVEMEFAVTMTQDARADGRIRVWVLDLGASAGISTVASHRVKITMTAKDMNTGAKPQISDTTEEVPPR